jgi:undecaprenyl-diphosphatase
VGWLETALRALVRGLTEFLPVSSSGDRVIAETLLASRGHEILFGFAVHVGILFAILLFFRRRVLEVVRGVMGLRADAMAGFPGETQPLLVGGVVALVSGLAALGLFVKSLCARRFHRFAYYVWAVRAALLIWTLATR